MSEKNQIQQNITRPVSSNVQNEKVWYPPVFPAQGRMPKNTEQLGHNCYRQESLEIKYRDELCLAANKRVEPPCCKTLHISLFFDGTNNNINNDFVVRSKEDKIAHPTNIARMFRATIGSGRSSGVPPEFNDDPAITGNRFFKFYIPGVGTPFPEVSDLDYSVEGMAFARAGEDRVNWALLRLVDTLKYSLTGQWLTDAESARAVKTMGTLWLPADMTGTHNRYSTLHGLLQKLAPAAFKAVQQPSPTQPKLLGIKLYIYGFSRGAAEARTFVSWLADLFSAYSFRQKGNPEQGLRIGSVNIPVSIEFLGLLDTVATVGSAAMLPKAQGHMAWADGTMALPDEAHFPDLIKRCVHFVSAHEQRLCFPLDSVRRPGGHYPSYATEVVYPGMHSDVGGGYPRGDQGKGNYENINVDGLLLSQIALHDLYAEAFANGAPLKVSSSVLPVELQKDEWRKMLPSVQVSFAVSPSLINRFNAWRELTLKLPAGETPNNEDATQYHPVRASHTVEQVIEEQMAWITAWRIERYGRGSYMTAPFYSRATDEHSDATARENASKARAAAQKQIEAERLKMQLDPKNIGTFVVLPAGPKDFDPDLGKTQLSQAATEFREDYNNKLRTVTGGFFQYGEKVVQGDVFIYNDHDESAEYEKIKSSGNKYVKTLFPDAGENSNASQPSGLVRALFDDQVHDSRAWFMHAFLGSRELFGGYFLYRTVFFGEKSNKSENASATRQKGAKENNLADQYSKYKENQSRPDELTVPPEVWQKVGENYIQELNTNSVPVTSGDVKALLSGIW